MNTIRKIIVLKIMLLVIQTQIYSQAKTGEQWQVIDLDFKTSEKVTNPLKVKFGAIFKNINGITLDVPGFYNDANEWVLRFTAPEVGKWNFKTYSSLAELTGKKGNIQVSANRNKNQHGPITVSKENSQKFIYADGTPYFLMAFELDWLFALDWDNPNDIPKTKEIIGHVADHNFNQIVMNVYAYDANWGERDKIDPKNNYAKPKVFQFGGTNEKPDHSTLNIDFFKHLDRVISHLDKKGIVAHLMIYVWNKKVNWPEPRSEADNMYFDYVVKRYQAYPNLIWDISKEALAYGRDDMSYITDRIERLRRLDGYKRLVSVHDYTYCNAFPGEVDFISIQEWRPNLYSEMLNTYKKHSNKPVFNIEHGGYEKTMHSIFDGQYRDPLVCLDRNYQCIFAGTYSTYYWQNTSWYNVITDPFSLPKEQRPAFNYYQYLAKLFEDYNFNHLYPEQYTFTPYALTNKKDTYLFYIPQGLTTAHGDLSNTALKGKKVSVTWFDPLTGNYISGNTYDFTKGSWMEIEKHSDVKSPFAVLILKTE